MPTPDILESEELLIGERVKTQLEAYITTLEGDIDFMRKSGMSDEAIKVRLLDDLENGGRIFSPIKSIPKNAVKSAINGIASQASNQVQIDAGIEEFTWVTISQKPCPDCQSRSGETESMEFWETVGKPRSGFSVCGTNCKCRLVSSKANPPSEVIRE